MATQLDFVEFICEQISDIGFVRYKKMFGDYMIYLEEKPIFLVCDNILYVKIVQETTDLLTDETPKGFPYDGAKIQYIIEELDDKEFMQKLATLLETITPLPKKKKK